MDYEFTCKENGQDTVQREVEFQFKCEESEQDTGQDEVDRRIQLEEKKQMVETKKTERGDELAKREENCGGENAEGITSMKEGQKATLVIGEDRKASKEECSQKKDIEMDRKMEWDVEDYDSVKKCGLNVMLMARPQDFDARQGQDGCGLNETVHHHDANDVHPRCGFHVIPQDLNEISQRCDLDELLRHGHVSGVHHHCNVDEMQQHCDTNEVHLQDDVSDMTQDYYLQEVLQQSNGLFINHGEGYSLKDIQPNSDEEATSGDNEPKASKTDYGETERQCDDLLTETQNARGEQAEPRTPPERCQREERELIEDFIEGSRKDWLGAAGGENAAQGRELRTAGDQAVNVEMECQDVREEQALEEPDVDSEPRKEEGGIKRRRENEEMRGKNAELKRVEVNHEQTERGLRGDEVSPTPDDADTPVPGPIQNSGRAKVEEDGHRTTQKNDGDSVEERCGLGGERREEEKAMIGVEEPETEVAGVGQGGPFRRDDGDGDGSVSGRESDGDGEAEPQRGDVSDVADEETPETCGAEREARPTPEGSCSSSNNNDDNRASHGDRVAAAAAAIAVAAQHGRADDEDDIGGARTSEDAMKRTMRATRVMSRR